MSEMATYFDRIAWNVKMIGDAAGFNSLTQTRLRSIEADLDVLRTLASPGPTGTAGPGDPLTDEDQRAELERDLARLVQDAFHEAFQLGARSKRLFATVEDRSQFRAFEGSYASRELARIGASIAGLRRGPTGTAGEPSDKATLAASGWLPGDDPPTEHEWRRIKNSLRAAYAVDFPAAAGAAPADGPTQPPARQCHECRRVAAERAELFHPDSDVGPWDEACPACGHLHPSCPTCSGEPLRAAPASPAVREAAAVRSLRIIAANTHDSIARNEAVAALTSTYQEAEPSEWRSLLLRYGGHDAGCRATDVSDVDRRCTCGFGDVRRAALAAEGERPA